MDRLANLSANNPKRPVAPTHSYTVNTASKIQSKVQTCLSLLFPEHTDDEKLRTEASSDIKPVFIELTARSPIANKLISVVEIVKREAARRLATERKNESHEESSDSSVKKRKLWQYTGLDSEPARAKIPPPPKKTTQERKTPDDVSPRATGDQQTNGTNVSVAQDAQELEPQDARDLADGTDLPDDEATESKKRKADDTDDGHEFFETLEPSTKRLCEAAAPEKFKPPHPVPLLKIILSWQRLPRLEREGWGEQCVP